MELQATRFGPLYIPPHLALEIEETQQELAAIEAEEVFEANTAVPQIASITVEQQQAMIRSVATIVGVPLDKITNVTISFGSIILTMDLPLDAAARLLALYTIRHPSVEAQGIVQVEQISPKSDPDDPKSQAFWRAFSQELRYFTGLEEQINAISEPQTEKARIRVVFTEAPIVST